MQATDVKPAPDLRRRQRDARLRERAAGKRQGRPRHVQRQGRRSSPRRRPTTPPSTPRSTCLSPEGGTALGIGVADRGQVCIVSTSRRRGATTEPGQFLPAAIVLESDGAQNRGTRQPLRGRQLAKAAGIRIYGVALGTRHGYIVQGTGLLREVVRARPIRAPSIRSPTRPAARRTTRRRRTASTASIAASARASVVTPR